MITMITKNIRLKQIIATSALLLCTLLPTTTHAQNSVDVLIHENGTERKETIDLPVKPKHTST